MRNSVDDYQAAVACMERHKPFIEVEGNGPYDPFRVLNMWALTLAIGVPSEASGMSDESRHYLASALWSYTNGFDGEIPDVGTTVEACETIAQNPNLLAAAIMQADQASSAS